MVVLDTSTLLYWTLDPAQLSIKANQSIDQADQILISSISIWEIALKVKRGRLVIPITITDYTERLQTVETLEIRPVDVQNWLDNIDLPWEHRDPADRTIVALAASLDCPLITSDQVIADYYPKAMW